MKRRSSIGVAAGLLLLMLLPGVATATPGNPFVGTFGQCRFDGGASGTIGPSTHNRTGSHGPTSRIDVQWVGLTSCS